MAVHINSSFALLKGQNLEVEVESLIAPKVVVKNTFIDVEEGVQSEDRRRVRTAPAGALAGIDSDTEDEEEDASVTCSSSKEESVSESVKGSVWELSLTADGSRAVQDALESARTSEERCGLALELKGHIWDAAHDLNANYVLQKMITLMQTRSLQFIIDELMYSKGAVCLASRNKYACRVIQRLFEFCSQSQVMDIVEDLLSEAVANCCDQYAKYVVQCFLDHGTSSQVRQLTHYLAENVQDIATNPHGCSVLGKAMSVGRREDRVFLSEAISSAPGLLRSISSTMQGHFVAKAVHALKPFGTGLKLQEQDKRPVAESSTGKKSRKNAANRRGSGGGALAQQVAEARDLLESLRAACARRSQPRISKSLDRVQMAFSTPWAPPALQMEALQSCEHARQLLWALSVEKGMYACPA